MFSVKAIWRPTNTADNDEMESIRKRKKEIPFILTDHNNPSMPTTKKNISFVLKNNYIENTTKKYLPLTAFYIYQSIPTTPLSIPLQMR